MCGDRNPLHSDPEFAAAAGFPRPILHGLCTYGMTSSRQLRRPVRRRGVPGETLRASIWKEGDGFQAVVAARERDDAVALAGVVSAGIGTQTCGAYT